MSDRPIQTITYEVAVEVHDEPLLDDHDIAHLATAIEEAAESEVGGNAKAKAVQL